ncbi:hypothetical protein CANMA_001280 [Candida margitis]|uniref:uncharacterized protein n=1 Tax=Candida margitis TaxID=1775924 RepID=UPI002225EF01|nr:uncharacterized protein CANMA_001280 [Candida margitis]KAI5969617.1 hypothetical protein CANMA_001280 [Candida margitis]
MQESINGKGKGKGKEQGEMSPAKTRAGNSNTIDEDWSIISSSSDFDDERSTTSSDGKPLNTGADNHLETSDIDSSIFQVPKLIPGLGEEEEGEEEVVLLSGNGLTTSKGKGTDGSEREPSEYSPLSFSSGSQLDDSVSEELAKSANVGSKIKFFENMSMFNESIKQRSSEFYSNYAKDKIDQLNRYVNEQNRNVVLESTENGDKSQEGRASGSGGDAASSLEVDTDLETTVELQAQDDTKPQQLPSAASNAEPTIPADYISSKNTSSFKVRVVKAVQDFLDSHSEYLYYYLFAIVVGIIPAAYVIHHMVSPKEPEPVTAYETLSHYWDNFVYEKTPASSNFFAFGHKKLKVNRFVKYAKQVRTSLEPKLTSVRELASQALDDAVPITNDWLRRSQNALKLVSKNAGRWYEETTRFSKREFKTLKELASKGSVVAAEYGKIGSGYISQNGRIVASNLSNYTRKSVNVLHDWAHATSAGAAVYIDKSARLSAKLGKTTSRLLKKLGKKWERAGRYGFRRSLRFSRQALRRFAKSYPRWRKSVESYLAESAERGSSFWSRDSFLGKQIRRSSKTVFKKYSEYVETYNRACPEEGVTAL